MGDTSCEWASWFRSHHTGYRNVSISFDFATWKISHTQILGEVRHRLPADGSRITTERQNSFKLRGSSGAIISGQPNLIAVDSDGQATVFDIESGAERDSDVAQDLHVRASTRPRLASEWSLAQRPPDLSGTEGERLHFTQAMERP